MNNLLLSLALLVVCVGGANSLLCYFCANCPYPFYPAAGSVTQAYSNTGFCAKKSNTAIPGDRATRGPAEPSLCSYSGCRWTNDPFTGQRVYVCCCRTDRCNTGSITSKLSITVLLGALAVLGVNRYI